MFYPRHSILENNPSCDKTRTAAGSPKYVQRASTTPVPVPYVNNMRAAGGRLQTGRLKVKTIVIENLADGSSFPYVGGLYAEKVQKAMGPQAADKIFRVYYQENAGHGAFLMTLPGKAGTSSASVGGILHQALLDLAQWAERGVAPLPSTRYRRDSLNQVVLPAKGSERFGHQLAVHLTAYGRERSGVDAHVE